MEEDAEENSSGDDDYDDDDDDDSASDVESDCLVEFVGIDNSKKLKAKSSAVVQDLVRLTGTISPLITEKSAGSESEVLLIVAAAEDVSSPDLPNNTPVANDEIAIDAIMFAQEEQDIDCII